LSDFAAEIFDQLNLAGSERAEQARYDQESFAREKRAYARRLRRIIDDPTGIDLLPVIVVTRIQSVIADLEA
jgi:hypothetical protein